ncbi:MAG: hypothetical protein Q7T73_11955, partial [Beijerinckiaceae bacterium]|nr:hypothetical protein [Beijerinckiaceae bacterium]
GGMSEVSPFQRIKRLALDCKPAEVNAALASIVRICIDAERSPATPYFVKTYLDALADLHGYHSPHWTADELAISLVQTAPALDGVDPVALEPACAQWLQNRRKG